MYANKNYVTLKVLSYISYDNHYNKYLKIIFKD